MWAEIASYVRGPMGAYPGHYGIILDFSIVSCSSKSININYIAEMYKLI